MSSGGLWQTGDIITASRMNQKTVFVGSSEPSLTYPGQLWFDTSTNKLKMRNSNNNGWIETFPPSSHSHSRSEITDFWSSPFWNNIPDKPSTFPPSAHASSHQYGGTDLVTNLDYLAIRGTTVITTARALQNVSADASIITSGTFSVDRIPTLPRSKISDFFSSPFWTNIPDKPSTYPPDSHGRTAHTISLIPTYSGSNPSAAQGDVWFRTDLNQLLVYTTTAKQVFPADWNDITNKPSTYPPSTHASSHQYGGSDLVTNLDYLAIRGTTVITTGRTLQNVTADASIITSGTFSVDRIPTLTWAKMPFTTWSGLLAQIGTTVGDLLNLTSLQIGGTTVINASRQLINVSFPINFYGGTGSTILRRDDTAVYGSETSWTKKKEMYLSILIPSTCTLRIYFEGCAVSDGYDTDIAYFRIYRNGSPYGTTRVTYSTSWTSWTEDLSFSAGDYVQIYCYCAYGIGYGLRNFRILGISTNQLTDMFGRIRARDEGGFEFGDGSGTFDTNLYRSTTDVLRTDDTFSANAIQIAGTTVIDSSRRLQNIATVLTSLNPTDNAYSLGTSSARWLNIHTMNLYVHTAMYVGTTQILDSSRNLLNINRLDIGATTVITSARVLQNVTADASIITSGTFAEARIPHTWTSPLELVGSWMTLHLKTTDTTDPLIKFYTNNTLRATLGYSHAGDYLYVYDEIGAKTLMSIARANGTLNIYGGFQIGGTTVIDSSRRLTGLASVNQSLTPTTDLTYNLGSSSLRWNYAYIRFLYTYGTSYMYSVLPASTNTYSLGSTTYVWLNVYSRYLYMYGSTPTIFMYATDSTDTLLRFYVSGSERGRFGYSAPADYFYWYDVLNSRDIGKLSRDGYLTLRFYPGAVFPRLEFWGNRGGTSDCNIGAIDWTDTYLTGNRTLHLKGLYSSSWDSYVWEWMFYNGTEWQSLAYIAVGSAGISARCMFGIRCNRINLSRLDASNHVWFRYSETDDSDLILGFNRLGTNNYEYKVNGPIYNIRGAGKILITTASGRNTIELYRETDGSIGFYDRTSSAWLVRLNQYGTYPFILIDATNRQFRFLGYSTAGVAHDVGYLEWIDARPSGQRSMQIKMYKGTDDLYYMQWHYWNGSTWNWLMTLTQSGILQHNGTANLNPSRTTLSISNNTWYQNTSGKTMFIHVIVVGATAGQLSAYAHVGPSTSDYNNMGNVSIRTNAASGTYHVGTLYLLIPPNWYYRVIVDIGSISTAIAWYVV